MFKSLIKAFMVPICIIVGTGVGFGILVFGAFALVVALEIPL